jgi:hypothetical protein
MPAMLAMRDMSAMREMLAMREMQVIREMRAMAEGDHVGPGMLFFTTTSFAP